MCVGGDHTVTLAVLRVLRAAARTAGARALRRAPGYLGPAISGCPTYHGSTFRRAMEEGPHRRDPVDPVGIRAPVRTRDFDFHATHGFEVIRIEDVKEAGRLGGRSSQASQRRPVYCSFDIDAVDPAYAPATGTPEAGGLTSYEALVLVRGLRHLQLVGADLVEVSPPYDGPAPSRACWRPTSSSRCSPQPRWPAEPASELARSVIPLLARDTFRTPAAPEAAKPLIRRIHWCGPVLAPLACR